MVCIYLRQLQHHHRYEAPLICIWVSPTFNKPGRSSSESQGPVTLFLEFSLRGNHVFMGATLGTQGRTGSEGLSASIDQTISG